MAVKMETEDCAWTTQPIFHKISEITVTTGSQYVLYWVQFSLSVLTAIFQVNLG